MESSFRSSLMFWPRWFWRQLTSMRTALFLLLLLALAAVPGSLYPQRSADPNGVRVYYDERPELAAFLDALQLLHRRFGGAGARALRRRAEPPQVIPPVAT